MKWEKVKLGDIAEIVSGTTPKTNKDIYWNGSIKWITPAELKENIQFVYDTERKISNEAVKKCSLKLMPKGTVLLSSRAPIGKIAITTDIMCCNQGFKNFICSQNLNNVYLYYFLKNNITFLKSLGRGATFKEISKKIVEDINIPLPPLHIQEKIASILDKASLIIEKRKKQIQELNELSQCVFIKMFGDPVLNPMGWEVKSIFETLREKNDFVDGPFGSDLKVSDQTNVGIRIIQVNNIGEGFFKNDIKKYISIEKAEELKRHNVFPGDVLIAKMGEPVAKCTILPEYIEKAIIVADCMRLRCNNNEVINHYMVNLMNHKSIKKKFDLLTRGSTRIRLNLSILKEFKIPIPPLSLQQKFATIIENIEDQKSRLSSSLSELEENYKSLMQRAFNGEIQ